ncbi:hypothetical protein Tco_0163726 [Tanacetum coccineum]
MTATATTKGTITMLPRFVVAVDLPTTSCFSDGLKVIFLNIENGPLGLSHSSSTSTNILIKPQKQWSPEDKRLANKRLKIIIISCLPNDVMKSVIKTGNSMLLKLGRLKMCMEPLQGNTTMRKVWLIKSDSDLDVEEDTRSSSEFLADLNVEFHYRALQANLKRFYKSFGRIRGKCKALKAKLAILTKKIDAMSKNKSEKGRGKRKETSSSKEVLFTKSENSSSKIAPEITSSTESDCDNQEPLPPIAKLSGAKPNGTSNDVIPLANLTQTSFVSDKTKQVNAKESSVKAIKKKAQTKSTSDPDPSPNKKADSSTEQLLLTLMEEVKGLKEQIKPSFDNSASVSQTGSSKSIKGKQHTRFGPCKHCGFKNRLSEDCYNKPKCITCQSTDHLTKEHPDQVVVKKTLSKLRAQSSKASYSRTAPKIPKPFIPCKYYRFNNHHSDECEYYPGCDIYGSIAHEPTNYYLKRSVWYQDSGCPRHITWVKQYLHKYLKELGPKVVFGDKSSGVTEGYGLVNCNGITFTRVAFVNGLKHNLINISQLCGANFKVLFTKTEGTIFNKNNEVVLIAPRKRDVYVIDIKMENLNDVKVKELRSDNRTDTGNDDYPLYVPAFDPLSTNNIIIPGLVIPTTQDINSLDESPEFSIVDDHPVHNEPDYSEPSKNHSDTSDYQNITINDEPISEAEPSPTIISPSAKILHDTLAPKDRWSRDKHILLVNILGEP